MQIDELIQALQKVKQEIEERERSINLTPTGRQKRNFTRLCRDIFVVGKNCEWGMAILDVTAPAGQSIRLRINGFTTPTDPIKLMRGF